MTSTSIRIASNDLYYVLHTAATGRCDLSVATTVRNPDRMAQLSAIGEIIAEEEDRKLLLGM
jgi:hypothetical protein